jgi:hypothetical protein
MITTFSTSSYGQLPFRLQEKKNCCAQKKKGEEKRKKSE